jgi:aryl-alcohol dehydrogenase-like predicted oxidoreductase
MNTRKLGNSDLMITPIGFGAWAVGGPWQFGWGEQSDHDSIAAIHRALDLGINWIDTAAVYGLGHSEEVVARALRDWAGKRPYVFTKCGMVWNDKGEVGYSLRAESIRRECKASLRRLKADIIDLYQILGVAPLRHAAINSRPSGDIARHLRDWCDHNCR